MLISELGQRLGGDPRGFVECRALREELGKLNHPARPDVDWHRVEALCLALQQDNGLELQSMVVLILARSHLYALPGVLEGVQSLNRRLPPLWGQLWPYGLSARLELLSWVFDQLQPMLRTMELTADDLSLVQQLKSELDCVSELLMQYAQVPVISLQALSQQLGRASARLSREAIPSDLLVLASQVSAHAVGSDATKMVTSHTPDVVVITVDSVQAEPPKKNNTKRLLWMWVLLLLATFSAIGLGYWRGYPASTEEKPSIPIELDSLLLFSPGRAELRPEATKVLVNSLINIRAQPDWSIEITGHTDSTGDSRHNLEISLARAAAVKDWMQQMGEIPGSCFVVRGFGSSQPVQDNDSEAGRAANRRVEIRLVPHVGVCRRKGVATAVGAS